MKSPVFSKNVSHIIRILSAALITAALIFFCRWCTVSEESAALLPVGILCSILAGLLIALPFRFPRPVSVILCLVLPLASFYLMESLTHNPQTIRFSVQILEFIFFYLLYGFLFFVTGRMSVGFLLANFFVLFVGIANYYVLAFRDNPILPWDLNSLTTAASVADNFTFAGSVPLMAVVIGFVFCSVLAFKCRLCLPSRKPRLAGSFLFLLLLGGYTAAIQTDTVGSWFHIYEMPFTQGYTYKMNGFFVSFLVNAKYLKVDVPADYSGETASFLMEKASSGPCSANPRTTFP